MAKLGRTVQKKKEKEEVVETTPVSAIDASEVGVEIEATVLHYYNVKEREKVVKKDIASDQKFIKQYFSDNDLEEFEIDGIKATVTEGEKLSFIEESLLPHLKKLMKKTGKIDGLIRRKEYIDYDVLEDAIYKELLDKEQVAKLAEFQSSKITKTLRIKGPKK